jgi:glycosyltransferase involved in cell wall biosynthesis
MHKSINVLHIIGSLTLGGAEVLLKNILNNENNSTLNITVLSFKNGNLYDLVNKDKKSKVIVVIANCNFEKIRIIKKIIKEGEYDFIHVHQGLHALFVKIANISKNYKVIQTYHGLIEYNSIFKRFLFYLIAKYLVFAHVFVSNTTKQFYLKKYRFLNKQKTYVLYNGVDYSSLMAYKNNNLQYVSTTKRDNKITGGMIANFNSTSKDHFSVCKALKQLIIQNNRLHFIFVGKKSKIKPQIFEKSYKFCKENNLLDNIHFVGQQNNIGEILKNLNFYIQASFKETFGISVVEAMSFGIPCFISDIPAFKEISNEGQYAILFETGNAKDLEIKLQHYFKDTNKIPYDEIAKKAKEYVLDNFSIENHIQHLEKIYTECII